MKRCQTQMKQFRLLAGILLVSSSLWAAGSPVGDVVGKLTVGYQGWFSCSNDASPLYKKWTHWATNSAQSPKPGNTHFDLYPDVREYTTTYQTGYANLGNGSPARLFSSYDSQVINKHVEWMQTYKIDTAALQRFGVDVFSSTNNKAFRDSVATKLKNASETYGRKFYIMYDITGWSNFQTQIKQDWTNTITGSLGLTNSSAYAKQNGKPVVCIWGIGCDGNPGNGTSWNDVVNFFKGKNCYVIIGTKRTWATNTISVYTNANMISPWTVGAFTNIAGANSYANQMASEQTLLNNRGQDFQPVVFAGFSWANWKDSPQNKIPRYHGDFMWSQFYNIRNKNIPNVYVAMFDEYDEATAIAKAAENSGMKPTNQWFLTLDADGVACSSDYYLRLTGDGGRMVKNQTGRTSVHPTSHRISTNPNIVINPSFEVDTSSWTLTGAAARSTDTAAEGGVASMKLNAASSYARQTIPLEMGKAYEISVWINVTGLTAGSAYFDTTDKYDGTGQGQFSFSAVNGGWQRYLGSFTATNTSITLRCFTSSTFAGTAYYDLIDVRVQ